MRSFVKRIMRLLFALGAAPLCVGYWCQARCMGPSQAMTSWSQLLSLVPGLTGVYLRYAFYAGVLERVGTDASISFGVLISDARTTIGRAAYLGPYCVLGEVEIGDDVLLGSQVSVMNGAQQHGIDRLDIPIREQPGKWPRVTIGCDSWIGDRAIVMANVGKHCVVGAGSVVTKPVPDYAIVVGNPARVVKDRSNAFGENDD